MAGASEGIGAAFAEALARRGIHLWLLARREAPLADLARDLRDRFGTEVLWRALDLGDTERTEEFLGGIREEIGLLVYNAAYSPIAYFENLEKNDLERILAVNVRTPLHLVKELSQGMIGRGRGGLILMSSLSGTQGSPKIAAYAATKSFTTVLAEGLWHELRQHGVDVLATCAGAVRTPGYRKSQKNGKDAPGTLDPAQVAESALKALGKGPVVVPGLTNRLANFVMGRLLPRKTAIGLMHKNTKNLN